MRLKILLTLSLLSPLIESCATQPKVSVNSPKIRVCVVDGKKLGCNCYDERTKVSEFLSLQACDRFVAISPQDFQELLIFSVQK